MAVKIRLKRLGKIRQPQYRVVVMDSRTKRDGRAIEEIGKYHPKEEPSLIEIDSERAQYWLSVGAQPTEQVAALLKITGDWQKFKGEPGAEGTLKKAEPKADKKALYEAALKAAQNATDSSKDGATTAKKKADAPKAGCRGREDRRGLILVLEEALEHLVKGIVDHDGDVVVRHKDGRRGELLEVRVHPDDLGRVIGRSGRTASALRTVVSALAGGRPVRVDIVDTDRAR